jgi:tetratricopeptide (TPR) repeat protein
MALKEKILDRAQKFIQKGYFDKAIAEYKAAVEVDPKDTSIRLRIGDLYVKTGKKAEALKEYLEVAKVNSQRGFYLKAIAVYKQALKLDESSIEIHYKLAELYTKQRLIADALSEYGTIVSALEAKGKSSEVVEILKKMVEIDPENIGVRIKLAEVYQKLSYEKDALNEYAWVFERLMAQGKYDRAEKIYVGLYNARPKDAAIINGLVDLYRKTGNESQFLRYAVPLHTVYKDSGDAVKAKELHRQILECRADDIQSMTFLAQFKMSQLDEEFKVFEESISKESPVEDQFAQLLELPESELEQISEEIKRLGESIKGVSPEEAPLIDIPSEVFAPRPEAPAAPAPAAPPPPAPAEEEFEITIEGFEEAAPTAAPAVGAPPGPPIEVVAAGGAEEAEAAVVEAAPEELPGVEEEIEEDLSAALEAKEAGEGGDTGYGALLEAIREEELEEVREEGPAAAPAAHVEAAPAEAPPETLEVEAPSEARPSDADVDRWIEETFVTAATGPEAPVEAVAAAPPVEEISPAPPVAEAMPSALVEVALPVEPAAPAEAEAGMEGVTAPEAATGTAMPGEAAREVLAGALAGVERELESEEIFAGLEAAPEEAPASRPEEYVDIARELGMEEALKGLSETWSKRESSETYDEFKDGIGKQLVKEDSETHYNLGIAYMEMEMYAEAIKQFKIALKDPAFEFDCYTRLGLCSMAESNAREAIAYYLKGLKAEGRSDEERTGVMYELALAYEAAGNRDEAGELFRSVHAFDPHYREVAGKFREYAKETPLIPLDDGLIEVELLA